MDESCDAYKVFVVAFACYPRHWLIIGCAIFILAIFIGSVWIWKSLRKDIKRLEFATWKIEQLADRIRMQEPNSSYIESVTKKLHEHLQTQQKQNLDHLMLPTMTSVVSNQDVHSMVQQQKAVDEQKALKESGVNTPLMQPEKEKNSSLMQVVLQETKGFFVTTEQKSHSLH